MACCLLVEVAENGDAEDDHDDSQSDETGGGREQRPITSYVGAKEGEFGYDEEAAEECGDYVADAVEKEEFGDDKGLDQHDRAGDDDSYEADNVHDTDKVEDDVARPSQGFFKERHFSSGIGRCFYFARILAKREKDTDQQL